jgi:hypothetical protein
MTTPDQRRVVNQPARSESHSMHRPVARPCCTLQEREPEDLQQTVCDTDNDEEKRLTARTDPASFRLHAEFVRWRGMRKGEYTTFFNGVMVPPQPERD